MSKLSWVTVLVLSSCPLLADLPHYVEEAETIKPGVWTLDLGVLYRDEPVDFGVPDREAQLDIGRSRLSFGLGRAVELQLTGTALMALVEPFGERDTENNSGDWEFATKVWLRQEKGAWPGVSFYYSVKLPNASDEKGSGTDETDFNTYFLFDKKVGERFRLSLNLGLGILGDPFTNSAQNDVFTYGLDGTYKLDNRRRISLAWGGETGPKAQDDPQGIQLNYTQLMRNEKWAWYASFIEGFNEDTDNYVLYLGFRRGFKFGRNQPKRRFNDW